MYSSAPPAAAYYPSSAPKGGYGGPPAWQQGPPPPYPPQQQTYLYHQQPYAAQAYAPASLPPPQQRQHQQNHQQQQQQQQRHQAAYSQQGRGAAAQRERQRDTGHDTPNPRPMKRRRDDGGSASSSEARRSSRDAQQQEQPPPQAAAAAAAAAQQPLRGGAGSSGAAWHDALQQEVRRFAAQAAPTQEEQQRRQSALRDIEGVVRGALSWLTSSHGAAVNVQQFGSGRAGMALHCSDLDVVITGLAAPTEPNGGFDMRGKRFVADCLRQVEREAFRRLRVRSSKLIAHARIPVLKLHMGGVELDVSVNDTGGIKAANFLQALVADFAALKPLVLVLKAVLKQNGLGDVATGGLGSWSICNMVVAHLMEEDRAGENIDHLGHMLVAFLRRFGRDWDINADAVAVAQGGIVRRASLATPGGMPFGGVDKLALKDPLTGREVAGGSHRYADVARLFSDLHRNLAASLAAAAAAGGGAPRRDGDFPLLSLLLDCRALLARSGEPQAAAGGGDRWGGRSNGGGQLAAAGPPQARARYR